MPICCHDEQHVSSLQFVSHPARRNLEIITYERFRHGDELFNESSDRIAAS